MPVGLLLIHAFPLDATMWQPQTASLNDVITTIAPNFPGFGGTPGVGAVTSMESMADVCIRALDEAHLDSAVVCGLSMGGYAALSFWRKYPGRVAGLVLANTRAGADDEAGKGRRADLATRLRAEGNDFLVQNPPPLLSANSPQALVDLVKQTIAAQPAEAIAAASLGMAERPDAMPWLTEIAVPTLVITSGGDALIPPHVTKETADAIPGAVFREIPGVGHLSNLEAPEAFNDLIREHLARCGVITG